MARKGMLQYPLMIVCDETYMKTCGLSNLSVQESKTKPDDTRFLSKFCILTTCTDI